MDKITHLRRSQPTHPHSWVAVYEFECTLVQLTNRDNNTQRSTQPSERTEAKEDILLSLLVNPGQSRILPSVCDRHLRETVIPRRGKKRIEQYCITPCLARIVSSTRRAERRRLTALKSPREKKLYYASSDQKMRSRLFTYCMKLGGGGSTYGQFKESFLKKEPIKLLVEKKNHNPHHPPSSLKTQIEDLCNPTMLLRVKL